MNKGYDPNEILLKFGPDGLRQRFDQGRRMTDDEWSAELARVRAETEAEKQANSNGGPSNGASTSAPSKLDEIKWPDTGSAGRPAPTCTNARVAIVALGIECRYDVFHDRKLVSGHVIQQWSGELSDDACQMLRVLIKKRFGFDPGKENTSDGAVQLCLQHQFDPVCDYLAGLRWDGKPRIDNWLVTYMGAKNTKLTSAIGRLSLVAAVRRARKPGTKFDQIIVFEGPEGTGKSTAIEIMAGKENFSDSTILGLDDRAQQEAVCGVWLYEIADLAGMSKADVDRTKAFASRKDDRARKAYGRLPVSQPRRCVFFATTNNETYLKSQTGNRRFWPVATGRIDLDGLRRDRDQLWAEAAHLEFKGSSLGLAAELWSTARVEQDRRRDHEPWDDLLADVAGEESGPWGDREERVSSVKLYEHLKLPADKQTDHTAKRLSSCMQRLGWVKPEDPIRIGGKKVRGFSRKIVEGRDG